jgi:hypothetical protein
MASMLANKLRIAFDRSALPDILESFGNTVDKEGYIVDKKTKQRVVSPDGDYVHESEFAGIIKGSKIYLKSDTISLIEFVENFLDK